MLKVFVTNLNSYAEGYLKSALVSIPREREVIQKSLDEIFKDGGEEYIISASEGLNGLNIPEHMDIFKLNDIMRRVTDKTTFVAILECLTTSFEEAIDILESGNFHIIHDVESMEEAAEILIDEGYYGEIPPHLKDFINYTAVANDMITSKGFKFSKKAKAVIARV